MRKFLVTAFAICSFLNLYSQSKVKVNVTNWQKQSDNKLLIEYLIPDAREYERYKLKIVVYDNHQSEIIPFAITGDFPEVSGIGLKKIYWDVLKDRSDYPMISSIKIEVILISIPDASKIPKNSNETGLKNETQKPQEEKTRHTTIEAKGGIVGKGFVNASGSSKSQGSGEDGVKKDHQNTTKAQTNESNKRYPKLEGNQSNQNATYGTEAKPPKEKALNDQRKKFTIGVHGAYGICSAQKFSINNIGDFSAANGGARIFGIYLGYGHFVIDVSKTDKGLTYKDDNNTNSNLDINSLNASLDFYTDMPASPKHSFSILLGFGAGSYMTKYADQFGIQTTIRKDEIAYYPKCGIICKLSKYWKLFIVDAYHLTEIPMNDLRVGLMIGI